MPMIVECLEVGPLMANCYLVGCPETRQGLVLDPGGDAERILEAARRLELDVRVVVDTHCHPDHTGANVPVREATGARLLVHSAARAPVERPPLQWLLVGIRPAPCPVDGTLEEGDQVEVGNVALRVMHLPGHSPGSIALVGDGAVFTGDVLFAGGVGRTDLPGGNYRELMASLRRLATDLPPQTVVYPGHGPASTIGQERATNEWLQGL